MRRPIRALAPLVALLALLPAPALAQEPPPLPAIMRAHTPSAACSAFLPEDRPVCAAQLAAYQKAVAALEAKRATAKPVAACRLHCDMLAENWKLRDETKGWSERTVRTMASGAYEQRNASLASLEERRRALREERDVVAAELADLRKQQASRTERGKRRVAEREARLSELDAELQALVPGTPPPAPEAGAPPRDDATERLIASMWAGHCSAEQAADWIASCRTRCAPGAAARSTRDCAPP